MKIFETLKKYDFEGFSAKSILKNFCKDIKREIEKCRKVDPIPETPDNYDDIDEEYYNSLDDEKKEKINKELEWFPVRANSVEFLRIEKFKEDHYNKCSYYYNGKYRNNKCHVPPTIQVSNNGIGTGISIKCENCGKVVNVTDYEQW